MAEGLNPRYARPCNQWSRVAGRHCGAVPTRLYIQGPRCRAHTPSALAGQPEPPEGRCAPGRCLCGKPECPAYETFHLRDRYAAHLDAWAVVDARAIASGKRRAGPDQVAAARAAVEQQRERDAQLRRSQREETT